MPVHLGHDDEHKDAPRCVRCGSPMRYKKSDYGDFWGCSKYPECKGKLPLNPTIYYSEGKYAVSELIDNDDLMKQCFREMIYFG